jgi:hypothetical protein
VTDDLSLPSPGEHPGYTFRRCLPGGETITRHHSSTYGMSPYQVAAQQIAARYAHGHDELTDGCALCVAEYNEVFDWCQNNPMEQT